MKNSTKTQLSRYGILALAGLSCESAKAGIVTSSQNFTPFTIGAGESNSVDFGGGIGSLFRFAGTTYFFSAPFASFVLQQDAPGANQQIIALGPLVPGGGSNDPLRLAGNYAVSAGRNWVTPLNGTNNDIAGADGGNWNGAGTVAGFLGIRFQSTALSSGFHYGFFDVAYDNTPDSDTGKLTIRGWAYEDIAGASINTFDVNAPAAPEPSSLLLAGLGLLSCGAAGIRSLRSQKKTVDSPAALGA